MNIPKHIAIIMDGNGRWASKRSLPRIIGHQQGVKAVRKVVKACGEMGVQTLTLFAFSSENKNRSAEEDHHRSHGARRYGHSSTNPAFGSQSTHPIR